jgi:hypothetical protein
MMRVPLPYFIGLRSSYILGAEDPPAHNRQQRQPALWCRLPVCNLRLYMRKSLSRYLLYSFKFFWVLRNVPEFCT